MRKSLQLPTLISDVLLFFLRYEHVKADATCDEKQPYKEVVSFRKKNICFVYIYYPYMQDVF